MYVSECFQNLAIEERTRLERRLGIILRRVEERHQIRKTLRNIFESMEVRLRAEFEAGAIWTGLLDHFCILPQDRMTGEAAEALKKHPLTFWPESHICTMSAEAMEVVGRMDCVRESRSILSELLRMGTPDKRALSRWLGLDAPASALDLYSLIGQTRGSESPDFSEFNHRYLTDLFPEDAMALLWFYRGVLPLYECLRLAETENIQAEQKKCLEGFRLGYLIAEPLPVEFGQTQKFKIVCTREKNAGMVSDLPSLYKEDTLQRSLF